MVRKQGKSPRKGQDPYEDGGKRFDEYVHDEFPNPLEKAAKERREERERKKRIYGSSLWLEVPLFFVFLGVLGMVVSYHQELHSKNECDMTFIYRPMIFNPIVVRGNSVEKYSLVRYHEGYRDESILNIDIPVLFVPGSSGSGKQVRSLATTIMNRTALLGDKMRTRFVFFACDFDEELSFLSGATLIRQREFVVKSIETILQMYAATGVKKLLLVGHSFGGTILHSLPAHPRVDLKWMNLVITLGAPINKPPFKSDYYMELFYEKTMKAWKDRADELTHVTVVSYSGGLKDFMVPDHLARSPSKYTDEMEVIPLSRDARVIFRPSWSLRDVGCDVDHNCLAWCNQLIRHISSMLINYGSEWKLPKEEGSMKHSREVVKEYYLSLRDPERRIPASKDPTPLFNHSLLATEDMRNVTMTEKFPYVTIDLDLSTYDLIVSIRTRAVSCPEGVKGKLADLTFQSTEKFITHSIREGEWMTIRIMPTYPDVHELKGVVRIGGTPGCEYQVETSFQIVGTFYRRLMDSTTLPFVVFYTLFLFAIVPVARRNRLPPPLDYIFSGLPDGFPYFVLVSGITSSALIIATYRKYLEKNALTFILWAIGVRFATFIIGHPAQPILRGISRLVEWCHPLVRAAVRLLLSMLALFIASHNVALGYAFVLFLHLFKVGPHSKNGLILIVFSISILVSIGLAGNVRDGPTGMFQPSMHELTPSGYMEAFSNIFYAYPHPLLFSFIISLFCFFLNLAVILQGVDQSTKEMLLGLFYALLVISFLGVSNLESMAIVTTFYVLVFEIMKEHKGLKAADGKQID